MRRRRLMDCDPEASDEAKKGKFDAPRSMGSRGFFRARNFVFTEPADRILPDRFRFRQC